MSDKLFGIPSHGSALDQLATLRAAATRRTQPAETPVVASPIEAFAAGAEAPVAGAGGAATQYAGDAAVGVIGNDPDALARAAQAAAAGSVADPAFAGSAQQLVDVQVQPRLIIQGQQGPIVIPVDVAVPAAQSRVTIAQPTAVVVDPATGQPIATQAGRGGGVPTGSRQGLREMSASDIGAMFGRGRGRSAPAGSAPSPQAAAGTTAASGPSLADKLRAAASAARGPVAAAPPATGVVAEVATPTRAAGPSLLDQLRGAASTARGPAAGGGAVAAATEASAPGPNRLAGLREGLSGLGALRHAPAAPTAAPAAEIAAKTADSGAKLGDRALAALRAASKVSPRG